jgi:hypothetical protein
MYHASGLPRPKLCYALRPMRRPMFPRSSTTRAHRPTGLASAGGAARARLGGHGLWLVVAGVAGVLAVACSSNATSSEPAPTSSASVAAPVLAVSAMPELPVGALSAPILEGVAPVDGRPEAASNTVASAAPLSASAPKQVTFGVALVAYRGAQGAGPATRTREEALALADKISEAAKGDFPAAIKKADVGLENAGLMPRGVLEPGPEQALFGLAVGDVSKPVDSPRGYYVFKRID